MDYEQALEWVHTRPRLAKTPDLGRMRLLMAALGNPQRKMAYVHVAGTNGKGSTAAMVASILNEAGYTVGLNTSPFVVDFCERFVVNGQMLSREQVAQALTSVRQAAETLPEPIKEFEAVTAAALYAFARLGCTIVCLEAGIGGRYDSTNIVENTLVACITRIAYDHMEILGNTLAEIAADKCGIFKNGCTVVQYPAQAVEAADVVAEEAAGAGCPLVIPDIEDFYFYKTKSKAEELLYHRVNYGGYDLQVPFPGRHQSLNAAVAVEAALALCGKGLEISDQHIMDGIRHARLPARIEILNREPLVILDGAHNEDSAQALANTLEQAGLTGFSAVIGVLQDKGAKRLLELLAPYIHILYATAPISPRALPAEELAELARGRIANVFVCDTVEEGIALAREDGFERLLVCGSFYLAGEARRALEGI